MSVVLRCPTCGTTQGTPGECEACHEAQVRYFCINHDPGHWLDGPTCPSCEAVPAAATPAIHVHAQPYVHAQPHQERPDPVTVERAAPASDELGAWVEPPWMRVARSLVLARTTSPRAASAGSLVGRVSGCLLRVLLLAVVLIMLAGMALYLMAHAMFSSG